MAVAGLMIRTALGGVSIPENLHAAITAAG